MSNGRPFVLYSRREKQSLERYLKDVPTVEEHQKLNKTISFDQYNNTDVLTYLLVLIIVDTCQGIPKMKIKTGVFNLQFFDTRY